eukprot:TRINITY_DN5693_c0_g1_i2.p1 TRINITY_DN5693_c0_g1~~TRINITY_DN5693_c0_g1_i2.p1  ORF type:complete len:146 (-),score=12.99 TRINITY_DN5693_c0_g1_i2:167-604(-)
MRQLLPLFLIVVISTPTVHYVPIILTVFGVMIKSFVSKEMYLDRCSIDGIFTLVLAGVCILVLIVVLCALLYCCCRSRKKKRVYETVTNPVELNYKPPPAHPKTEERRKELNEKYRKRLEESSSNGVEETRVPILYPTEKRGITP